MRPAFMETVFLHESPKKEVLGINIGWPDLSTSITVRILTRITFRPKEGQGNVYCAWHGPILCKPLCVYWETDATILGIKLLCKMLR
jgi:hypothetical protein